MNSGGSTLDDAGKTALLTVQLVVASTIGTISFLLFCFLRTRWSVIFASRSRLVGLAAPELFLPPSFFGWIIHLLKLPESVVLDHVGLDAAVLLAFFKMSYKLFAFCGIFSLIILSPIKFSLYYAKIKGPYDDPVETPVDLPETSGILLSYVIFTWVFSLATFYFTFYNYREFSEVRHRYYCKWKNSITTRTVMVTVIPKELQTDQALKEFYESLGLGAVKEAIVYKNVRKLRHATEKRAHYLKELERAYTECLGNPYVYPNYDPDEALREFEQNRTVDLSKFPVKRKKIRTGFLGIFGKEIDKIEYYTNLFDRCDKLVERGRHQNSYGSYKPTSVGFVTFESITSAQMAAQILIRPEPYHCRTTLAPEPRDVYWRNLSIRQREMLLRSIIVNIAVVFLVVFWSVIFTFISSMLSLDVLTKTFPWLARIANRNEILKGFIQGTLPTLLVQAFNFLLPKTMRYLSGLQGFHARSVIELSTFAKYYFFLLVNVLLIFSIAGTLAKIFKELEEIIKDPTKIPYMLATTLPLVSNFFVNLVILQGIGLFPVQLLQGPEILSAWFTRTFIARTPREYAEVNAPPFLDYGQKLPPIVLMFVVILVYSSITPLILLFGTIYFFLGYLTYKYLLLYVYFHPYETAGLAWPKIFRRIIVGLYIYQIMMIGYMSLRKSYGMAGSLIPLLIVTAIYYYYVNEAYDRNAAFIPLNILKKEEKDPQSNVDDVNLAPAPPPTLIEDEETPQNNQVTQPQNRVYSRTLDNDVYRATPDFYTDYSQPPMTLHDGILDTGIRNYGAPELYGILPWLWLPVKVSVVDRAKKYWFFGKFTGLGNRNTHYTHEEGVPLLSGYNNSVESVITSEPQSQLVDGVVASGSRENEVIADGPSREGFFREVRRFSRVRDITDKFGELAGKNFS